MLKVLVVSITKFYGGGESFINSHLYNIDNIDFSYLVASEKLYNQLQTEQKNYLSYKSLLKTSNIIKGIIQKNKIDLVILNGGRSLFLAPFIHKTSGCIGIRHTLNSSISDNIIYRAIYVLILNFCYIFMKKIVHVSKKSQSEQFFAKKRSVVIYNGVKEKSIEHKENENNINFLFVGRMTREKGVDILIDAFNEICIDNNSVHLYLVGTGEIDSSYYHCDNIHFEGFSTELSNYYINASWYISLTSRENCSISVIDALSYGLPVITTDVGGNPELIQDGYNGFLIERTKDAVISLFNIQIKKITREQKEEFSKNAQFSFNKQFDIRNQKKLYKELLESI